MYVYIQHTPNLSTILEYIYIYMNAMHDFNIYEIPPDGKKIRDAGVFRHNKGILNGV